MPDEPTVVKDDDRTMDKIDFTEILLQQIRDINRVATNGEIMKTVYGIGILEDNLAGYRDAAYEAEAKEITAKRGRQPKPRSPEQKATIDYKIARLKFVAIMKLMQRKGLLIESGRVFELEYKPTTKAKT